MGATRGQKRAVSIRFCDFSVNPEILCSRLMIANCEFVKIGDKRGRNHFHKQNFLTVWEPMNACEKWNSYVETLITRVGGWQNLRRIIAEVEPRNVSLRIDAPLRGSPYVEDNFLDSSIIKEMAATGLWLDFAVRDFQTDDPTHHPVGGPLLE